MATRSAQEGDSGASAAAARGGTRRGGLRTGGPRMGILGGRAVPASLRPCRGGTGRAGAVPSGPGPSVRAKPPRPSLRPRLLQAHGGSGCGGRQGPRARGKRGPAAPGGAAASSEGRPPPGED